VIRIARLFGNANSQESKQHPGEQRSAAARKRHPIPTRRIPVRTRTAIVAKEEERRRRDAAFRAASGHSRNLIRVST